MRLPSRCAPAPEGSLMAANLIEAKGFSRSLFDYSFRSFITARLIPVLYVLSTIILALNVLALILILFKAAPAAGIFGLLILGPLVFVIGMIYVRVILELLIVIFRIHEDVRQLNVRGGGSAGPDVPLPLPVTEPEPEPAAVAEPVEAPPASTKWFCKNCGLERPPANRFCTACGTAVD